LEPADAAAAAEFAEWFVKTLLPGVSMADSDEIFLRSDGPVDVVAGRVADALGLDFLGRMPGETELQYKVRALTFDGWIGVFVGPNYFDPVPGEVQAMDGYPVMVDVQARSRKPAQGEEARLVFEAIVRAMPEVPALLVHQVTMLVAAHLPGTATHYFGPGVTVDDPAVGIWRAWVAG
jgi:hypothetical protein